MVIELPEDGAYAPDPAAASAETPRPLSRPPTRLTAGRWAAGAAALAVLVILGYQVYKMFYSFDLPFEKVPLSTAVSGGATERREPGASGTIGRDAAAGDASVAKVDQDVVPLAAPASTSQAVPGDAALTPAEPRRASRPAAPARAASKQAVPRAESCTEAIAAVGLCSTGLGPAAKAETAAAAGRAIALPQGEYCPQGGGARAATRGTMHGSGRRLGAVYGRIHPTEGMSMTSHHITRLASAFVAATICLLNGADVAAIDYKIVTAIERGTYFAIGNDLAKFVAPAADIDLEVLPTDGSAANIRHLRYDPGVKFAIVQADVYQAFLDRAAARQRRGRHDHPSAARDPAALQHRDSLHRPGRFAAELSARHQERKDQRRPAGQRRGPDYAHALSHDVRRADPGSQRELPVERGSAGEADLRQDRSTSSWSPRGSLRRSSPT